MSQNNGAESLRIRAEPTKQLFIWMLTRDVALIPAIIDLVDNSTDGARRLRPDDSWNGLQVIVETKPDKFTINDNCGGIPVDVARKYAFRFGRPEEAAPGRGEVGRFGVGMKRGLFKLGGHFEIQSTTANSQFDVTIDVKEWSKHDRWEFEFDRLPTEKKEFPPGQQGTKISVAKLHPQVREHFNDIAFINELGRQLTSKLEESILKGLAVKLNDVWLKAHVRRFLADPSLAPAKKVINVKGETGQSVRAELWCGLARPQSQKTARSESGWYVFCNGRMLLEADKTNATGWGIEDEDSIPAYHPQFNGFRGFAYLEAADAADLPWNTTKTALDTDHPVYRRVKQHMTTMARPVIDFFNKRKEENDALKEAGDLPRGRLQKLFDESIEAEKGEVSSRLAFEVPKSRDKKSHDGKTQKISFECDAKKAKRAKEQMHAGAWREVGETAFEYYYEAECDDG